LGYWKAIGVSDVVLSWIAYGLPIRFYKEPQYLIFPNPPSYYENIEFIDEEVKTHLADGSFLEVDAKFVKCCNPIQVEINSSGKLRMCMNAKWPNSLLAHANFKLETIATNLRDVVDRTKVMFTTDMKKAYYSIPMSEEAWPYLCFSHRGKYYACTVLPFGESQAPMFFTKIMREPLRFLRILRITVLNYFDDWLWTEIAKKSKNLVEFVKWFIPELGFRWNEKCVWSPSTKVTFLGFIIESENYRITVPIEKIKNVKEAITSLISYGEKGIPCTVTEVQSVTGKLQSMKIAMSPVGVWTRSLYRAPEKYQDSKTMMLDSESLEELKFWLTYIDIFNGVSIEEPRAQLTVFCDSSETGWGGHASNWKFTGTFPAELIGTSSTQRELAGLICLAEAAIEHIKEKTVLFCMDSFCSIRNLEKGGGPKQHLCQLTRQWWNLCQKFRIVPIYKWIPREQNTTADQLSKAFEQKCILKDTTKKKIEKICGKIPVEFPNFNQIRNVIAEVRAARSSMVLVHPRWPAQSWWVTVMDHTRLQIDLGPISECCERLERPLPWKLVASALEFSLTP
jgi:hypothetical protein